MIFPETLHFPGEIRQNKMQETPCAPQPGKKGPGIAVHHHPIPLQLLPGVILSLCCLAGRKARLALAGRFKIQLRVIQRELTISHRKNTVSFFSCIINNRSSRMVKRNGSAPGAFPGDRQLLEAVASYLIADSTPRQDLDHLVPGPRWFHATAGA